MPTQAETAAHKGLKEAEALLNSEAPNYQVLPVIRKAIADAEAANPELATAVKTAESVPAVKTLTNKIEAEAEKIVDEVEADVEKVVEKVTGKKAAPAKTDAPKETEAPVEAPAAETPAK